MTDEYDSKEDTLDHVDKVYSYISKICLHLESRALEHDRSKLRSPEKEIFDKVTPRLKGLTYGSPEYRESLKEMGPALDHHYLANRHHPEHFEDGVQGMTLVDVVEMFCDWAAATERHADGNMAGSIRHNKLRFQFGDVLAQIFLNTAYAYQMGAKSELCGNEETEDE